MATILLIILHYTLCAMLILIILLQAGKGGGLASAFGGGASETIWGTRRGNIMTRITAGGVTLFMIASLLLAIILPKQVSVAQRKGMLSAPPAQQQAAPAQQQTQPAPVK
ncbi:preprotein translocase subunit SecG [Candidatus Desantisbacteria bacterium CG2_30_40_21]|uniref:Protein-export membrane protein SecG n=5 Tax=unclassified Candidatus Desantisiibacteriota TaxID=3106372 RepID=A0A2M7JBF2_9BACT|nr:MAG: preprotein translocase subunit SecG [Candidatus Desantisbacteria bacterium CG2_30_40_21]PIP40003.1 MAG: preprotein translocase subunit SecG [Candidatus Desantisbacteria bacterium CG23_combo_of_CG06-09_8_20_14_all_40_23]PIX16760.1 MAG: preprotein translocase subunit SecG [Candidatus Desantisbacteria bacterium CG_4_8_14_3_um_filter_40_12]PIY20582.1 MAG: preprotein translocase subunit SecG [Candidatus Desantisbacteria bacterium CG_4_10_14_3_um_filter_40_18]PJB30391.1 MAG: preprotein transl